MRAAAKRQSSRPAAVRSAAVYQAVESLESRTLFAVGALDPTFGTGGVVVRDIMHGNDFGFAVAVQSDNKVLVAGRASSGMSTGNDFAVARFNVDGSLDTSFGTNGIVVTDMGSANDGAYSIAVQTDGKIVVAGETSTPTTSTDFAVARYNANGSLDTTFGTGGKVRTDFNKQSDQPAAMKIDANGNIVVVGSTLMNGLPQFAVARYTPSGQLDTTFSGDGLATTSFANGYSQAKAVATMSDGSVVLVGTADDFNSGASDYAAVRFDSTGVLDTSFGNAGWAQIDLGGDSETAYTVAAQSDGKLILAGESFNSGTGQDDFGVARLTTSGQLDSSFGTGGVVFTDFGNDYDQANSAVVQSDGRIVVAGVATVNGVSDFGVVRYLADGSLDSTFGGGKVVVGIGSEASAGGVAIDGQGQIVVAGFTADAMGNYDFAAARIIGKINVAPTANAGGPYTVDSGGTVQLSGSGSFDPDGAIVSYAWDFNYDGSTFNAAATGASPAFSAAGLTGPVVRMIALRVTDDNGASTIITTTVTINAPPPPAPTPDPDPTPTPDPTPAPTPDPKPGSVVLENDPAHAGKKILVVYGTNCSDDIRIRSAKHGAIEVRLHGKSLGTFTNISRVVVYGQNGDDRINASGSPVPVALFGGKGDDVLSGSPFNDIVIGDDGNDELMGDRGDDVIVGGAGKDGLHSVYGNDLLIGGGLAFQDDLGAMSSILAEWTRTDLSLTARMNHLQNGGGLNGTNTIGTSTLVTDKSKDVLHGTPGLDWLVNGAEDKVDKLKAPCVSKKKKK